MPGQTAGDQLGEGFVRERRRGPDRGDLLGLLDRAQALDQPFDADQLDPVGQPVAQPAVRADRHVDGLEPEPQLAGSEHVADRLEQVLRRAPALERRVDLLGGLLDVAKVGDEHPRVRPDQRDAVAAGVAGEVADIERTRDEQHVDAGVGKQIDQAVGTRAHAASSSRTRSSASRYPSGPLPATRAMHSSEITDWRRHASRESTSDRCTSTAGSPVSSSASRIAYE